MVAVQNDLDLEETENRRRPGGVSIQIIGRMSKNKFPDSTFLLLVYLFRLQVRAPDALLDVSAGTG